MVTHNANLVVGTDAECVIVSNQSGQRSGIENSEFRFEYYTGSLECSFTSQDDSGRLHTRGIREHVCEILEGGIRPLRKGNASTAFRLKQRFSSCRTLGIGKN